MTTLSTRMQCIVDHLASGAPVWDLCCDHGYMGWAAWTSGKHPEVHFVDQVPEIIEALRQKWQAHSPHLHFHAAPAETLDWSSTHGSIIISGIGAHGSIRILNQIPVCSNLELVISPQKDPQRVRMWLAERGWRLINDHVIIERERFRQVIHVGSQGEPIHPFGNKLWSNSPTGPTYYEFLRAHFDRSGPGALQNFERINCQESANQAKIKAQ